jgi:hypothetical protein
MRVEVRQRKGVNMSKNKLTLLALAVLCGGCRQDEDNSYLAAAAGRLSFTDSHYSQDRATLKAAGKQAVPSLVRALRDSGLGPRVLGLATVMGEIDPAKGAQVIAEMLRDPDAMTREKAAECCIVFPVSSQLRDEQLQAAEKDKEERVRAAALRTLRPRGSPEELRVLHGALRKSRSEGLIAASVLALVQDQSALPALRLGLLSVYPADRGTATAALGEYKKALVRGDLTKMLHDPDPGVQNMAKDALSRP